jgi:hypothetical protein
VTRAKISEYSATANDNTDVNGINIAEGCPPSSMNNMGREIMAALKRFQVGSDGDGVTVGGQLAVTGTTTTSPAIVAAGDTNTGIFFPAADTIAFAEGGAEAARLNSSGFLGLGYTDPRGRLYVGTADLSSGSTDASNGINLKQTSTTAATGIYLERSGERKGYYMYVGGDADSLTFQRNNNGTKADTMALTRDGNVGIGTTSPQEKLQLEGSGSQYMRVKTTTSNADIYFGITSSNVGYVGTGGADPVAFFTGGTEKARITSGGYFKASDSGTYVGAASFYHEFRNTTNNVGLVINNTNASLTTGGCLFVEAERNTTNNTFYAISYYNNGAIAYKFRVADSGNVTNTNNSYGSLSDVKLKQDIVDAGSQWNDIKNLRVRKYRWKSDPDGFMQMGLVAQEVEEVSPGLVDEHPDFEKVTRTREVEKTRVVTEAVLDEDGNEIEPAVTETYTEEEEYTEREPTGTVTKAVKYSVLYMKAVKALQEAMDRIETLEASNTALEARIAALEQA